ncbi:MAG TPA: hypothetical protein VGP92_15925 [Acidimicrobiia bacterium]|nr:hypothetical protein [Acidimicrobiia bacterium]
MTTRTELRTDDDRARQWLQRRLEWEGILSALRDAGAGRRFEPAPDKQEPAAA